MMRVREGVIESIILASRNTYPNEFLSLLGGDKEEIKELVVIPATHYGKNFSFMQQFLVPFDSSIRGSVHSHPSTNPLPSSADLNVFGKYGEFNMIIAYPFTPETIRAYNAEGKPVEYRVV